MPRCKQEHQFRFVLVGIVLLDFVQIAPPPLPPIWTTTTLFRRQISRFESQFKVQIIGILEEIAS